MPILSKEPWRYQQLVEAANLLKPWTPKLERLIQEGQQILKKSHAEQTRANQAQNNLMAQIKKIQENRSNGEPIYGLLGPMQALLEEAKRTGVPEAILEEGKLHLKDVQREGNRRAVAEHRLRLALSARDHMEIERSMRQVRALGGGLSDQNTSQASAGGANNVRSEHPNSARLMDAAGSMLRHLGEAASRRQTAAAALQQHLSGSGDGMGTQADAVVSQGWLKEAQTVLAEAEKCGVNQTIIEQAKIKIRKKRREHQEQQDALKSLQKVLSKKDVPQPVILANMRRVQRLQAKTFTDGFTYTAT